MNPEKVLAGKLGVPLPFPSTLPAKAAATESAKTQGGAPQADTFDGSARAKNDISGTCPLGPGTLPSHRLPLPHTDLYGSEETADRQPGTNEKTEDPEADTIPELTYRADNRRPEQIFAEGFKPWGTNEDLYLHAMGATCIEAGWLSDEPPCSAYVASFTDLHSAQQLYKSYGEREWQRHVYVVRPDPQRSLRVEAELARQGKTAPAGDNKNEVVTKGGIPPEDIRAVVRKDHSISNPYWKPKPRSHSEGSPERAGAHGASPCGSSEALGLSATHADPKGIRRLWEAEKPPAIDTILAAIGKLPTPWGGTLDDEYRQGAGVWEGYSLREHHAMVLNQSRKYLRDSAIPGMSRPAFELTLALHDGGKHAATEAGTSRQHQFTKDLLEYVQDQLPVEPIVLKRMIALIDGDPLGRLFTGKASPEMAAQEVRSMAKAAGMGPSDFLRLVTAFYQSDASSYTEDAGGIMSLDPLFVPAKDSKSLEVDTPKGRLKLNPCIDALLADLQRQLER